MHAIYRHPGQEVDYTPGRDVEAGEVIVQNDLVGVATAPILNGKLGSLTVEGVFDFAKDTGSATAIAAGVKVYWDVGNEVATATAGSNKLLGKAERAATVDDMTVRVRMSQ